MKGGVEMIMQIEVLGYAIIGFILSTITTGLIIQNIKLTRKVEITMQEMKELEMEMRFKFDLRK